MTAVLAYIPARGGSKGVPHKNKRMLGHKPLIAYTIMAAQQSRCITEIYVSSDDEEIGTIAASMQVPLQRLRPAALAQDDSSMLDTLKGDIAYLASQGKQFDYIAILQPNVPFRAPQLIDLCFEQLTKQQADSVVSMLEVPEKYNPHWVYEYNAEGYLKVATGEPQRLPRRQLLPKGFICDGAVYLFKSSLLEHNTFYGERLVGFINTLPYNVNIDSMDDWQEAVATIYAFLNDFECFK